MGLKVEYLDSFIKATEKGAIGAYQFVGKGDKNAADKGAVDAMREVLNQIDINGRIVIGEGEMDEAPMLFNGESVGTGKGQKIDIAVDPLEGTNFVAKNLPNSFSVLAIAESGNLFSAPDTYMEKIAIGQNLPDNLLDLDFPIEKNIKLLAQASNKKIEDLTACILKRPRHDKIVSSLKKMNVNIKFISDGDVLGVISVLDKSMGVDIYLGIGGGPEGVLASAALSCLGGQIQTRLVLNKEDEIRAKKHGIKDLNKKYNLNDLVKGDVMFFASAITHGELVNGITEKDDFFYTSTYVLHKDSKIFKKATNKHKK